MFKDYSTISTDMLDNNCVKRIKPSLLRDVKTEAVLVFARTSLERFLQKVEDNSSQNIVMSEDYEIHIYTELKKLLDSLQESVVNADYLINLVKASSQHSELKKLLKFEEPLMLYYDVMAKKVSSHYKSKEVVLPEFLIICVLSHWFMEEEKSTHLYPFIKETNFDLIIEKFEIHRKDLVSNEEDTVFDVHNIALDVVENLKKTKYKVNKQRVSKGRKK